MANKKSSFTKTYLKTVKREYKQAKKDVKSLGNILKRKPASGSLKGALKVGTKETTRGKPPPKQQRKIPKDITKRSPVVRKVPTRKKPSK
tara:strand:- start:394 stop:663 length:270 start_codon:yes stop_codon:yes gene_type:complete